MNILLKHFNVADKVIFLAQKIILTISVLLMVSVNFLQVLTRYVFHVSLSWSEQMSVALFMMMVLIGGNLAMKSDDEIKIDVIRFKGIRKQQCFNLIGDVFSVITLGLLLTGSIMLTGQAANFPEKLSVLPLYYYHLYGMMAVGFLLMTAEKLLYMIKRIYAIKENKFENKEVGA